MREAIREAVQAPPERAARTAPPEPPRPMLQLGSIGQRDEVVRQRIGMMMDRLEDLRSLQDDFSSLLEPLATISDELPRASMRIAELETLLSQEQQNATGARDRVYALQSRLTATESELAEITAHAGQTDATLREREQAIEELRIALRDRTLAHENLERQLYAEMEQNKALVGENKALKAETQAGDAALSRSEHELASARERLGILEQDNRRLQVLSEEQSARLVDLGSRHKELEAAAESDRQRLRSLEARLAEETAMRARETTQHETELGAIRTERAGLIMRLEAAVNRAASMDQLLNQLRNQIREKDDAFRVADRNFKEAAIARGTAERRFEAIQADLARQAERLLDMQRTKAELDGRCDMLSKALAAKDATIEQAASRNAALTERMEQVTARHEAMRAELEISNRRLSEDLQNERSERALVQGALDIARESRIALQKQYEALKRTARTPRESSRDASDEGRAEPNNVHPFTTPGKSV